MALNHMKRLPIPDLNCIIETILLKVFGFSFFHYLGCTVGFMVLNTWISAFDFPTMQRALRVCKYCLVWFNWNYVAFILSSTVFLSSSIYEIFWRSKSEGSKDLSWRIIDDVDVDIIIFEYLFVILQLFVLDYISSMV